MRNIPRNSFSFDVSSTGFSVVKELGGEVVEASGEAVAVPVALGGDAGVLSWFVGGSEDDEFIILNCRGYAAQIEQLLSLSRKLSTIRHRPVGSIIESQGALVARVCDKMPRDLIDKGGCPQYCSLSYLFPLSLYMYVNLDGWNGSSFFTEYYVPLLAAWKSSTRFLSFHH